ncbi:MAG: hypothetical protein AAF726_13645 [Planctomycetota bacterium]
MQPPLKPVHFLIAFLIAGAFIFSGWRQRDELGSQAKENVLAACSHTEAYAEDPEYVQALVEASHGQAFAVHCAPGGRRGAASFDESGYYFAVFHSMKSKATSDGRPDVAKDLGAAQSALLMAVARHSVRARTAD